jgi:hypothetical protein
MKKKILRQRKPQNNSNPNPELGAVKAEILKKASNEIAQLLEKYQLRFAVGMVISERGNQGQIQLVFKE